MVQSSSVVVLDVPIRTTKDVEKLELETKFRLKQDLEKFETEIECLKNKGGFTSVDQLDAHRGDGYRDIVDNEKRRVRRVTHGDSVEIILDPAQPTVLTTVSCSYLPHSYQKIKNKVWIESQPIYKAALDEWQQNAKSHLSKAERKTLKVESLKNEIYNLIGFYSVFQGVLVTASCQSSLLQCREVGFPIILSFCASAAALFGILQKFDKIHELDSSIFKDRIKYEKALAKSCRLKDEGESFRFSDFPSSKSDRKYKRGPSWIIVTVAVVLFSIVFISSHPLILCRQ